MTPDTYAGTCLISCPTNTPFLQKKKKKSNKSDRSLDWDCTWGVWYDSQMLLGKNTESSTWEGLKENLNCAFCRQIHYLVWVPKPTLQTFCYLLLSNAPLAFFFLIVSSQTIIHVNSKSTVWHFAAAYLEPTNLCRHIHDHTVLSNYSMKTST